MIDTDCCNSNAFIIVSFEYLIQAIWYVSHELYPVHHLYVTRTRQKKLSPSKNTADNNTCSLHTKVL